MSSVFPNWQKYAVHQRRLETGCIPTGYEMILRAAGAQNINSSSFQDDFDLDRNLSRDEPRQNNFESVAAAVRAKYSSVCFRRMGFARGDGSKKLKFVEDCLARKQPVLVSISNEVFGERGWHIMPVVDATHDELTLLEFVAANGRCQTRNLRKDHFVQVHDQYDGGDDVAYLVQC